MSGDSQEKNLPATEHRLRKEREKGHVATSSDFVSAAVALAVMAWLLLRGASLVEFSRSEMESALIGFAAGSPAVDLAAVRRLGETILLETAGLFALAVCVGVAANAAHKGGLVISAEPLKPDLSRIDPFKGFKRMFAARQFASLGLGLVAVATWTAVVAAVLWARAPATINSPMCGLGCVAGSGADTLGWLIAIGMVAIVIMGVLDLPLQVAFFRREMRMSHQERKQEYKETEGSPEVARQQQVERDRLLRDNTPRPTVIVVSSSTAVGIAYNPGSTPVPLVVSKGAGQDADRIVRAARQLGIPIHADPALSRRLHEHVLLGFEVPQHEFGTIAPVLARYLQ